MRPVGERRERRLDQLGLVGELDDGVPLTLEAVVRTGAGPVGDDEAGAVGYRPGGATGEADDVRAGLDGGPRYLASEPGRTAEYQDAPHGRIQHRGGVPQGRDGRSGAEGRSRGLSGTSALSAAGALSTTSALSA